MKRSELKEMVIAEMEKLDEFKGFPGKGKMLIRVKNKDEAIKFLKKLQIKYDEEDKELHGAKWYKKNEPVAELEDNVLAVFESVKKINEYKEQLITEALDKKDFGEIRDMIRAEIAAVFFDLFKKKSIWI